MPEQKLPRRIELRSEEHIASGIRNPLHKSKCAVFLENEHDNLVELIQYAERGGYQTDLFCQTAYYGNAGHLRLIKIGDSAPGNDSTRYATITSEAIDDKVIYRFYVVRNVDPKKS